MFMRMKKTYLEPLAVVLNISTASMIAVSGNFIVGETTNEEVHDETIDGGDAWSRSKHRGIWDYDEE
jgi:hypothetical protein